jgi:hypothetical protein
MLSNQNTREAATKTERTFHPAFMLKPVKPADYSDFQYRLRKDKAMQKRVRQLLHS